jgi:ubiquinone/menaquinone biosynthesis C-methylase UbiE
VAPHVHRHPSDRYGDFDAWAPTYDDSRLQRLFFDRVHAQVVVEVQRAVGGVAAPVVLDVGCGTGRLLSRLRAALPSAALIGVDAAAGMIEVASGKPELAGARLLVGSAAALPLDDSSCDVAVSTISFHHWEDQAGGLRDVARVLRPGGRFLLVDIFTRGPLAPLVRRFSRGHGMGMPSEGEVVRLLNGAALHAAESVRVGPVGSPLAIVAAVRP